MIQLAMTNKRCFVWLQKLFQVCSFKKNDVLEKGVKQPPAYTQKENEFTVRDANGKIHECPPSRELLGRHSWTLVRFSFPILFSYTLLRPITQTNQQKKIRRMHWISFTVLLIYILVRCVLLI